MDFCRRSKIFITQSGIDGQSRRYPEVILDKPGEISVALIFPEKSGGAHAFEDVALAAAILRRTLAEEEVRETLKQEKTRGRKGHIQNQLMAFRLATHSKTVSAPDNGDGILPDEGVGILKIKWLA